MEKYLYVVKDGYRYIAGAEQAGLSRERRMLTGMGAKETGYAALAADAAGAPGTFAVLRTSGRFSLTGSLPTETDLDRMLSTSEDEMHVWSSPPSGTPRDGIGGAAVVTAVMRNYLQNGGSRETLHALADSL